MPLVHLVFRFYQVEVAHACIGEECNRDVFLIKPDVITV